MSKSTKVVSDPVAELPVKNAKYIKNCTELYLSGKNIEELGGFERFVNLETLWLNNNKLRKIANLDNNFRIKHLYAYCNNLLGLAGSIRHFKFLHSLHLASNKINNLNKCLAVLSKLTHMKELDLSGNPVTQEEDYRLRLIFAMPGLEVLDCHKIKPEEKLRALLKYGRKGRAAAEALARLEARDSPATQRPPGELVGSLSGATLLLLEDLEKIQIRKEQAAAERVEKIKQRMMSPALKRTESLSQIPKPSFWKGSPCRASGVEIHNSDLSSIKIASCSNNNKDDEEQHERWRQRVKELSSVRDLAQRHDRFSMQTISIKQTTEQSNSASQGLSKSRMKKYALFGDRFRKYKETKSAVSGPAQPRAVLWETVF